MLLVFSGNKLQRAMTESDPTTPIQIPEQQLMPGMPGIYEVAGTALEELVDNKPALKVVLHAFRQSVDENIALKQQQSFDKAEIGRLEKEKQDIIINNSKDNAEKTIGTTLSFVGSIPIAFGVNILTGNVNLPAGYSCLVLGVVLSILGLVFSFYRNLANLVKR
jgi:hypothetical protein